MTDDTLRDPQPTETDGVDTAVQTTGSYGRGGDESVAQEAGETPNDVREADGTIRDDLEATPDGEIVVEDPVVENQPTVNVRPEVEEPAGLDEPAAPAVAPAPAPEPVATVEEDDDYDDEEVRPDESEKHYYVLKVASNRERTVKKALERQIKRENLEPFFGEVIIPTQKVKETKNGKVVEKEEKIWPGYIIVNMQITDDSWHLVRSISGIGDFAGKAGEPSPMPEEEVDALLGRKPVEGAPGEEKVEEVVKINIPFAVGDRIKVNETSLAGSEGDVTAIDPETGQVKVTIQFLGQPTDVDFEHWQLEKV